MPFITKTNGVIQSFQRFHEKFIRLKHAAKISFTRLSQPAFTCSKSTIETPELCVKSVQSYKEKHQNDITHPEVF